MQISINHMIGKSMQRLRRLIPTSDLSWRAFQLAIIWGFILSNAEWHWGGENSAFTVTVLGIVAASVGTALVTWALSIAGKLRALLTGRRHPEHELGRPVPLSGELLDPRDSLGAGQKKLR